MGHEKMTAIISAVIWAVIGILTISLFFVELVLTIFLFPFDRKRKINHRQCLWWANALIGFNPYWNLEVKGLEHIDPRKTYVMVANHQSFADIVVMYKTRMQFKWVAKESLFKVPFIGWCLSLTKHISFSRGKMASVKKVYQQAANWLRSGMSVAFFPEGTRSKTGRMGKFQNGAFKLAIREKIAVLPIAISGTREAIPRGTWLFKTKVFGRLIILPLVETKDLQPGDFAQLRDTVHSRLEGLVT